MFENDSPLGFFSYAKQSFGDISNFLFQSLQCTLHTTFVIFCRNILFVEYINSHNLNVCRLGSSWFWPLQEDDVQPKWPWVSRYIIHKVMYTCIHWMRGHGLRWVTIQYDYVLEHDIWQSQVVHWGVWVVIKLTTRYPSYCQIWFCVVITCIYHLF